MKIYESLTSDTFFIAREASSTGWLTYDGEFLDVAFEAVSAICTVGVSRGLTTEFDTAGRLLLMLMMFIGKVGPLTLGFFLATTSKPRVRYPSGQIYLG